MNIVILKGNLTRDPESRTVNANGKETVVTNFAIAVNRHFKRADGTRDKETTFIDCEAWDTGAKTIAEYIRKGDPILVHGALKLDQWTDKDSGQTRSRLKVRVNNFERLYRAPARDDSAKPESESTPTTPASDPEPVGAGAGSGDEIPF